jgi:hypothetical protein
MSEVCTGECVFHTARGSERARRGAAFYCYPHNTRKNALKLKLDSFSQTMRETLDLLILKSFEGAL